MLVDADLCPASPEELQKKNGERRCFHCLIVFRCSDSGTVLAIPGVLDQMRVVSERAELHEVLRLQRKRCRRGAC